MILLLVLYLRYVREWKFTTFMGVSMMMALSVVPSELAFIIQVNFYDLPAYIQNSKAFARLVFGYFFYGQLSFMYLFSTIVFTVDLLFRYILHLKKFQFSLRWSLIATYILSHVFSIPLLFVDVYVQDCILSPAEDSTGAWIAVSFYLYVIVFGVCTVFVVIAIPLSIFKAMRMLRSARRCHSEACVNQPAFVRDLYFGQITRLNMYYVVLYPGLFMVENLYMSSARIFTLPVMMLNNTLVQYAMYLRVVTGMADLAVFLLSPVILRNIHRAISRLRRRRHSSLEMCDDSLPPDTPLVHRLSDFVLRISPQAVIQRFSWSGTSMDKEQLPHESLAPHGQSQFQVSTATMVEDPIAEHQAIDIQSQSQLAVPKRCH